MIGWPFLVSLGALIALVAASTVRSGLLLRHWLPATNLMLSWPDNALRLCLVGLCILIGLLLGPGTTQLGWSMSHWPADVVAGSLCGVVLAIGISGAGTLVVKRWGQELYSSRLLQAILPVGAAEWAGVLGALLVAAALEELLFRSLPLGGLSSLLPARWLLWPLALFFGLLHWPQGAWGVAGTGIAAVVLSALFLAGNSIWLPLAAHYAMNVTQVVMAKRAGVRPLRGDRG